MQRIIVALLLLSALTAAYLGGASPAQQPSPPPVLKDTKVGIVNLSLLFNKYDRFQDMKKDLEKVLEPYKTKQKELEKLARDWAETLKDASKLSEKNMIRGQKILIDCKRQLEDLRQECKTTVGNRAETHMVEIWKEVNDRVREYSDKHGFHLIIAYGEPEQELAVWQNAKRKLETIDAGGLTQVYAAGGVDISTNVLTSLNDSYRAAQQAENDADEGGD